MNTIDTQTIRVAICTPYLIETVDELVTRFKDKYGKDYEEKVKEQFVRYGKSSDNLAHDTFFMAGDVKVDLFKYRTEDYNRGWDAQNVRLIDPNGQYQPHLTIIGSTESIEGLVDLHKPTGILCARYSIFYGKPSGYTGRSTEQGGYSLDIPKNVGSVRALLTHEPSMRALASRNEQDIRAALDDLNTHIETPILATPYLGKALQRG